MVSDVTDVASFVGMSLGVLKTCVTETTNESENNCCGTHGGVTGHTDPMGNVDIRTVTCTVHKKGGRAHACLGVGTAVDLAGEKENRERTNKVGVAASVSKTSGGGVERPPQQTTTTSPYTTPTSPLVVQTLTPRPLETTKRVPCKQRCLSLNTQPPCWG